MINDSDSPGGLTPAWRRTEMGLFPHCMGEDTEPKWARRGLREELWSPKYCSLGVPTVRETPRQRYPSQRRAGQGKK